MSYCHLSNVGINFNNGFGPQPGNTIRNEVAGATCLAASCGSTNTCVAPGALTVTNITGSGANIGWTAVSGASGYTLRYRAVGNANWTTTTNPANPYTVTGFPANEEVEVTVQSICGGGSSEFSTGILFKTGSTGGSGGGGSGATCGTPTGLGVQASIASAVAYWQAVTGAGSYFVSWKSVNSSAWSNPISTTSTNYNITSLAASQTYNVQVLAVCSGVNSAAAVTTFTTASAGVICGNPANLSATTTTSTAQTSWSGVSGAYAYQIQWKSANTSTWGPLYAVTTTGLNITSLSPATSYNVRVRAVCNTNVSNFITTTFTTQSAGGGGSGGGNCNIPPGLTASYIYATSARVSWQPAQGALNYTMRIKRNDSPSWFTFSGLPVTIVTVQNLTPATTYNVEVRANCSGGAASNYCTTYSFTTPAGLIGSGNEDRGSELVIRETPLRLTAMPNPGNGFFYIRSANETVAIADIQVINSMGTTVLTQQNMRFTDGTAIDISDQPAGIYFVRFRSALADIPSLRLVKL